MRRISRALLAALLVVATSCTDDAPPAQDRSATPTAVGRGERSAEAAAAARINVTSADLGTGWTGTPAPPAGDDEEAAERELYTCLGAQPRDVLGDDVPSDDFASAEGLQISSSVDFSATAEDAQAELDLLAGPKALACLQTSLDELLRREVHETGAQLDRLSLVRDPGLELVDDSVGYRLTATVSADGQRATIVGDLVALVRDRVGVTVVTFGASGPFPRELLTRVVRSVAKRAEAATAR